MPTIAALEKPRETFQTGLTPVEAAWVAELSPKAVNASIDRGEVKTCRKSGRAGVRERTLGPAEVIYLVLRREVGGALSSSARKELYTALVGLTKEKWPEWSRSSDYLACDIDLPIAGGAVKVELKTACTRVFKRWTALINANELVLTDPEIRGGEPVIRGTRIPVFLIAELEKQGASMREIAEDFPALNAAKIRAALAYARTHPRRGRPGKAPWRD